MNDLLICSERWEEEEEEVSGLGDSIDGAIYHQIVREG